MKYFIPILTLCLFSFNSFSQKITYSEPLQTVSQNSFYDIIGKVNNNFLLFSAQNKDCSIKVFDNALQLINNVPLPFVPKGYARDLRPVFIPSQDNVIMIYSFIKNQTVYCMGVTLNENAVPVSDPVVLDYTKIKVPESRYIYSVVKSEDNTKIEVLKIRKNHSNDKIMISKNLFNDRLQLLNRSVFETYFNPKSEYFDNFSVSNNGDFVFTRNNTLSEEVSSGSYIYASSLIVNPELSGNFNVYPMNLSAQLLNGINLKIDNPNNHVILNSFYTSKINIEGILSGVFDFNNKSWASTKLTQFGDGIRAIAKSETGSSSNAFNNYFINDIILRNDGSFILTAEDVKTYSASKLVEDQNGYPSPSALLYINYRNYPQASYLNSQNLWDEANRFDYRSKYTNSAVSSDFNNILAIEIDRNGSLTWGNVIHKSQNEMNNNTDLFSYSIIKNPSQLTFLFNKPDKEKRVLNNETLNNNGELMQSQITTEPKRGHVFLPAFAKQVDENVIIMPTLLNGRYCLSKIEVS